MATVNEKMTALADKIRSKTGVTSKLSIDGMIDTLDSIAGGGASVETCTVTLVNESPVSGSDYIVHYIDETQNYKQATFPDMFTDEKTITVKKNSILIRPTGTAGPTADGQVKMGSQSAGHVHFVTADMTFYTA